MTTGPFVVWTLAVFALLWIAYDLYVVYTFGLQAGKTISWTIYEASQSNPAIPFLTGLIFGLLFGHLFLGMDPD